MNIKFVVVSKDNSFRMSKEKLCNASQSFNVSFESISGNSTPLPVLYNKVLREERASREKGYVALLH